MIVFDGVDRNAFGSVEVKVDVTDLVALERAANRAPLLVADRSVEGTTSGATNDVAASCVPDSSSPDSVYRLRVTRRSYVEVTLETPNHDGVLHLRRSATDAATELACNDDAEGGSTSRSVVRANLDPGTYFVFVDGFAASNAGRFSLRYTTGEPRTIPEPQVRPPNHHPHMPVMPRAHEQPHFD